VVEAKEAGFDGTAGHDGGFASALAAGVEAPPTAGKKGDKYPHIKRKKAE